MAGDFWWTILVDCVRIGVRARSEDEAFRTFVEQGFPTNGDPFHDTGIGRHAPPKRSECSVRQSLPVEVEAFEHRKLRLPLTQDSALFDAGPWTRVMT